MDKNWSVETYRLDEVEHRFKLPCVIHVNEGYYSETDAEGFSQGDILSIDKKIVLHKVAANFAYEEFFSATGDADYVDLVEKEILVPLNYKGRLRVLRHLKNYDSVSELARDFPRYAKLRKNLTVRTEENVPITVQAGTVIELDRIIPGSSYGSGTEPDKLVVLFKHQNRDTIVGIPFSDRGKFRTEPDGNRYTIKEALDRYSLPQHVKFVDDEIKRVYTQDLMEGLSNMKTITETLRLNSLVTQTVLVGHYKPIEEATATATEAEGVRKRTLVVLPLDNKEIREIEVNVLKDATEEDYEKIFLVRNVSNTDELIDGSLYVDFVCSTSGMKFIQHKEFVNRDTEAIPPPLPPRPKIVQGTHKQTPNPDDTGDYLVPQPSTGDGTSLGFSLAELNFKIADTEKLKLPKKKHGKMFNKTNKKPKGNISGKTESQSETKPEETISCRHRLPMPDPPRCDPGNNEGADYTEYDEVDEKRMEPAKHVPDYKKLGYQKPPPPRPVAKIPPEPTGMSVPKSPTEKQVASVKPSFADSDEKQTTETTRKLFKDLSSEELVSRLNYCGLKDFAETCRQENLDGAFFDNMSDDTLKSTLDLKGVQLAKFIQMKDKNWMPS